MGLFQRMANFIFDENLCIAQTHNFLSGTWCWISGTRLLDRLYKRQSSVLFEHVWEIQWRSKAKTVKKNLNLYGEKYNRIVNNSYETSGLGFTWLNSEQVFIKYTQVIWVYFIKYTQSKEWAGYDGKSCWWLI